MFYLKLWMRKSDGYNTQSGTRNFKKGFAAGFESGTAGNDIINEQKMFVVVFFRKSNVEKIGIDFGSAQQAFLSLGVGIPISDQKIFVQRYAYKFG